MCQLISEYGLYNVHCSVCILAIMVVFVFFVFLVACYATLHPTLSVRLSVRQSVHRSVGPSVRPTLLFFGFCGFWPHCSCPNDRVTSSTAPPPPVCDWGSCVLGWLKVVSFPRWNALVTNGTNTGFPLIVTKCATFMASRNARGMISEWKHDVLFFITGGLKEVSSFLL